MARKYSRDNRGRFASGGGGATARGGRLRTAGGNKRKTETMKAAGAGGAGVMKGAVKRDPGAAGKVGKAKPRSAATSKLRPGELMNANAFPANAIAKSVGTQGGASMFGNNRRANLASAAKYARSQGYSAKFISAGAKGEVANWTAGGRGKGAVNGTVSINKDSPAWNNPNKYMREANKSGRLYATNTGKGIIAHEMAHKTHAYKGELSKWDNYNDPKIQRKLQTASKVSTYAGIGGPNEFIAEFRAGRATGRRYTPDVTALYREAAGKPKPSSRRRSALRKPK